MERPSRRHDLDFVRVAAFLLLIVYHVSLIYNSRNFMLKAPDSSPAFDIIHLLTHPWRMTLLFFISGAVTGMLLVKRPPGALRSARTRQLLLPFLAGMAFLIPPQIYVFLNAEMGVHISLLEVFWNYLTLTPVSLPSGEQTLLAGMQHLWYLLYLWSYTVIITLAVAVWPSLLSYIGDRLAPWLTGKWVLIAPALLFIFLRLVLRPIFPPSLEFLTDWYSHAVYMAAFVMGAVMATRDDCWDAIVNMRRPALILTVACAVALVCLFPSLPSSDPEMWRLSVGRILGGTFQWCAIVAVLGYARIWCRSENAVIRYLNRAVLTYYVLHQTVMLLIAYGLDRMGLLSTMSFIPIAVATLAICAVVYELKLRLESAANAKLRSHAA
ncbi:acyltransferase family protein [Rhizobium sp. 11515TR]|uniref:acyltransferase family protein n=1 Tax=unclassified Rhizobium TaxID=2613769 RepID=UPI000BA840B3|nr:acyltransferase family protein [Rhizobium sp. 11515TR]ASW09355.1 acyltransferase [Rhizobium sp. 11515TR]